MGNLHNTIGEGCPDVPSIWDTIQLLASQICKSLRLNVWCNELQQNVDQQISRMTSSNDNWGKRSIFHDLGNSLIDCCRGEKILNRLFLNIVVMNSPNSWPICLKVASNVKICGFWKEWFSKVNLQAVLSWKGVWLMHVSLKWGEVEMVMQLRRKPSATLCYQTNLSKVSILHVSCFHAKIIHVSRNVLTTEVLQFLPNAFAFAPDNQLRTRDALFWQF